MPFVTVGTENSAPVELHYQDQGSGRPLVLIHGFPLDGSSWEPQTLALLDAGYRVVTYDRRGFGKSSQPALGYDYDTFADDLDKLLTHLDLADVTLVGFSMGTGEIARYIGRFGSSRIRSTVMIAAFGPQLSSSDEDPTGIPEDAFEAIRSNIRRDRAQYLHNYLLTHYIAEENLGTRVSEPLLQQQFQIASAAGAYATLHCVDAWHADFRSDLKAIDVPLLVMHGTEDRNIPIDFGARRVPEFVPHAEIIEIPGGPHGIGTTHVEIVNPKLLEFVAR